MGYVINGKYYEGDPPPSATVPRKHPLHKQFEIDRGQEEFRRDIIQPYLPNGRPNPEFIQAYPQESKSYFTDEQIMESERP